MLPQEVRDAKQVVEDYKKFNQNTVKQVVRRCPKTKAIFYKTVKVDENATNFIEKYKKEAKKKKQEKHLGKQLMSSPKKKNIKVATERQPRVYIKTGLSDDTHIRMKQAYEMSVKLVGIPEIAQTLNVSVVTVYKYISEYRKMNNIEAIPYTTRLVLNLLNDGFAREEIAIKLNLNSKTILYHMNKLKKTHPEIIVKKEQRKPEYHSLNSVSVTCLSCTFVKESVSSKGITNFSFFGVFGLFFI